MFSLAFHRTPARAVAAALLFFAVGIASAQTQTFAPSVIGNSIVLEGRLDVLVEDYADRANRRHFLVTPNDRIELKFAAGKAPNLASGTRVRVHGLAQADAIAVDGNAAGIEVLSTVMPNTMGEQSIAVLLVNFQDDASQPKTLAEAQSLVLGDTSNHYQESSFGQTWFKGKVFGWYTIAMSKTTCDPFTLASLADAQAAQAGVNLGAFQRRVYMFPANKCEWMGLGHVGGPNTQAWINGMMTLQVVGHELGHNYGLDHAHSLDCNDGAFGGSCFAWEYGDAADLMGNNRPGQFNPFEKERLGWLNDGISPPITTAATSGHYAIEPYSASTVGPKALKIPRGVDANGDKHWYYLEYRQPIGGDSVLANVGNLTSGVIVRTAVEGNGNSSYQLDMTTGSSTNHVDELSDGALAIGESHIDPDAGVTFTVASANSAGAGIDVVVGPPICVRATPVVSLASGGATAGSTVGFALKVTNRDSRACAATTFVLAGSVPTGWTGTLASTNLTLAPGASASTVLNVTSAASAAVGSYGIGAAASSAESASHVANAAGNYNVIPPCTRAAPTISLTGGTTAVRAGTTVDYTVHLTNRDSSACEATNFTLASSIPAGWAGTLGATTVALGPGGSSTQLLRVTSDTAAAVGSYGIGAAVGSPLGATHAASASASYIVAATCTRAAPTVSLTGGGIPVAAGSNVAYTLSVTNRDSSACPATSFTLARSVPASWTSSASKSAMALNPGATDTATINVASTATSAGGSYGIGAAVSSALGATHTASAVAKYIVAPKLSVADVAIVEGNAGAKVATFTVRLSTAAVVPVAFNIATANGTAVAGSDYAARSVVGMGIPAGSASATFAVSIAGDAVVEGNETFVVNVSGVKNATVADAQAVATIRNDDTVLTIADAAVAEGNSGTKLLSFTVKLSAVSAMPVAFGIATANGTALAGTDYLALALNGQSIPAGATSKVFNVTIKGDTAKELNENFVVNIGGVAGAVVGDAQALGTIVNDD